MKKFRGFLRGAFSLSVILSFIVTSVIGRLFIHDPIKRQKFFARFICFYAGALLWTMNIKLRVLGQPPDKLKNYLIVSNHTGFVDILALASLNPSLFITSLDMKETPGLGLVTEAGGCLYVNRKSRLNIQKEIISIRQALTQGLNVILYPEAFATNGDKIYPFKKTLMTAVAGTGIEIFPVVVNFRKVNREPMSHRFREAVFWYGPTPFLSACWKTLQLDSVELEIEYLTPIQCHTEESRNEVAANAQSQIESKYTPIPIPI